MKKSWLDVQLCKEGTQDCDASNDTTVGGAIKFPKHSNEETVFDILFKLLCIHLMLISVQILLNQPSKHGKKKKNTLNYFVMIIFGYLIIFCYTSQLENCVKEVFELHDFVSCKLIGRGVGIMIWLSYIATGRI